MSIGQPHPSSVRLTQKLLCNRKLGEPSRQQPVVVLLGLRAVLQRRVWTRAARRDER